jgi:DNA-binding NarL/FixJ family response regulator
MSAFSAELSRHGVAQRRASRPGLRDGGASEAGKARVVYDDGMSGGDKVRVMLVDDQALLRAGFRLILEAEPDLEVVGEAADGLDAVALVPVVRPDVVLMDIRMPRLDGVEATRRITGGAGDRRDPQQAGPPDPGGLGSVPQRPGGQAGASRGSTPKVLILTTFDLDEYVFDALRAGASGFLLKDTPPEELAHGVRVVAAGAALLSPSVTRRLIEEFAKQPVSDAPPPTVLTSLTARELEVLKLIARGLTNAEIATELFVSETTVKTHVGRILDKLHLRDRVQAVVLAYETGLVLPGAGG